MGLAERFPPLYQCSQCGAAVKVTPMGEGVAPRKEWTCVHTKAPIWANRKVTLRGKGELSVAKKTQIKVTLTLRQFLSAMTGRSI